MRGKHAAQRLNKVIRDADGNLHSESDGKFTSGGGGKKPTVAAKMRTKWKSAIVSSGTGKRKLHSLDDEKKQPIETLQSFVDDLSMIFDVKPPELVGNEIRNDVLGSTRGNTITLNTKADKESHTFYTAAHEFSHYLHSIKEEDFDKSHDDNVNHSAAYRSREGTTLAAALFHMLPEKERDKHFGEKVYPPGAKSRSDFEMKVKAPPGVPETLERATKAEATQAVKDVVAVSVKTIEEPAAAETSNPVDESEKLKAFEVDPADMIGGKMPPVPKFAQDQPSLAYLQQTKFLASMNSQRFGYVDALLKHGEDFGEQKPMPKKYAHMQGEMRLCFMNAYHLAAQYPDDLRYVEGIATAIIPVHHAWCVDKKGNVLDPTWDRGDEDRVHGRNYFGTPIDLTDLMKVMVKYGTYGYYNKGPEPKKKRTRKAIMGQTIGDLFAKSQPENEKFDVSPLAKFSAIMKVKDASGHDHDERGLFTGRGVTRAGVPEHIMDPMNKHPHLVMMVGQPGVGKGAQTKAYIGGTVKSRDIDYGPGVSRPDLERAHRDASDPNKQTGAPVTRPPVDHFSPERVVDPDEHKKSLVHEKGKVHPGKDLYTDEVDEKGMYGPSGPKNAAEFAAYPPEVQAKALQYVKDLGHGSIEDFAKTLPGEGGQVQGPNSYGGGLTHEISSAMARKHFGQMVDSPEGGSFIYDAVGNPEKYKAMAREAQARGFDVTFHHVDADPAVGHERASLRKRRVASSVINHGYAKSQAAAKELFQFAQNDQADGNPNTHFIRTRASTRRQSAGAAARGWTGSGHQSEQK